MRQMLAKHLEGKQIAKSNYDIHLLLMSYIGINETCEVEKNLMEMRKEFEINGYKFAIGIVDQIHFSVGFLTWPHLKQFTAEELRKYRYAIFQAQHEMSKMQNAIEKTLRNVLFG